jgi:hypothetical protein
MTRASAIRRGGRDERPGIDRGRSGRSIAAIGPRLTPGRRMRGRPGAPLPAGFRRRGEGSVAGILICPLADVSLLLIDQFVHVFPHLEDGSQERVVDLRDVVHGETCLAEHDPGTHDPGGRIALSVL